MFGKLSTTCSMNRHITTWPGVMTTGSLTCTKPKPRCVPKTRAGDTSFQPRLMKALFQCNRARADIMETHLLRPVGTEVVTKMLACGTPLMGSQEWHYSNPGCTYHCYIHQSY